MPVHNPYGNPGRKEWPHESHVWRWCQQQVTECMARYNRDGGVKAYASLLTAFWMRAALEERDVEARAIRERIPVVLSGAIRC